MKKTLKFLALIAAALTALSLGSCSMSDEEDDTDYWLLGYVIGQQIKQNSAAAVFQGTAVQNVDGTNLTVAETVTFYNNGNVSDTVIATDGTAAITWTLHGTYTLSGSWANGSILAQQTSVDCDVAEVKTSLEANNGVYSNLTITNGNMNGLIRQ